MTPAPHDTPPSGGALPLSPLIHGRVRLLILCHILNQGSSTFTELRAALGLTDGTLSVHLAKLAAGKIVRLQKRFVNRRPQTTIRMTAAGRRQFQQYVEDLRGLVPGLIE